MPARSRLWTVLAAAVSLAVIGVRTDPEEATMGDPVPPTTYPIAADAEAERTHASANFSATWIHDGLSPDAPGLRDKDRDGVPDVVQGVLAAFESARAFLLDQMGYRAPPTSGPTRIYIADVGDSAFTKLGPVGQGDSRSSFFLLPASRLRPPGSPRQLRLMAVHEYFHAIQNGYDSGYDHWIGEASAAWMEDVFDDAGDPNHRWLPDFVPSPRVSLTDASGVREYGAFLFIQFLVERFGNGNPGLVREIWEQMGADDATKGSIDAIDAVLARRGVPFDRAWSEFLLWRWDLDRFEEGKQYRAEVGQTWPSPLHSNEVDDESCRLSSDLGTGLPPLSGDYSVFRPQAKAGTAAGTVTVEGRPGSVAFVLVQKEGGKEKTHFLGIDGTGLASGRVRFGGDQVKRVVLGVGNSSASADQARFGYSLRLDGRSAVEALPVDPPADTSYFGGLRLQGRVFCNGEPAAGADLLLVQEKQSGERRTFPMTALSGGWSLTFQPEQTSTYRLEVVDPLLSPATSSSWEVGVRVALTLEVPDPDASVGEPVQVEGKISPPHPGAVVAIDYRRPELSWRSGPQTSADSDGSYRAVLTLPAEGIWHLRATVVSTGDGDHLGTETVHDVLVNVR